MCSPSVLAPAGEVALRVVAGSPSTAGLFRMDQLVAAIARRSLWLTDAYFVGVTPYVQALRAAARDGVDVRLLVPNTTDLPLVRSFSRAGYRPLLDAGVRIFEWNGSLPGYAFAAKLGFTALTLGAGFLGGEVTPLFFIGAALGNALASLLGLPLALGAGVGLAAVFATCANTPLALSLMAVELLGANVLPHVAIVASVAYVLVGHRGIYPAQRLVRHKSGAELDAALALRDVRPPAARPAQGGGGGGVPPS